MSHMQAQIIGPQDWWEVETTSGTFWVQCADVGYGKDQLTALRLLDWVDVDDTSQIMNWNFKSGYGARLSAPGYLDCTDWCVLDTENEAREYLHETWDICPACLDSLQEAQACKCVQAMSDEWHEAVEDRVHDLSAAQLLSLPGVHEAVSEMFNNEIIEALSEKAVENWRNNVESNTKG